MKTTILNYIMTSLDNGHFLWEGFSGTVLRSTFGGLDGGTAGSTVIGIGKASMA